MALHVADGSAILSRRSSGSSLGVWVGSKGSERYGSCLSRLALPHLAAGYLPILETQYVDETGARLREESFAARIPQTRSLVSFVRVSADTRNGEATTIRFTSSEPRLVRHGNALTIDGRTVLAFGAGAAIHGSSVAFRVPAGRIRTVYLAWLVTPTPSPPIALGEAAFTRARSSLDRFWRGRLAQGMTIEVPERRVEDAYRSVLVQDLALTWRYSVGNQYEEFSYPEGIDVAQVLSAQGMSGVARSILVTSLGSPVRRYPNWKMGQKLVGSALYYRLVRDRSYVERATPVLRSYVETFGRQIRSSDRGMLGRERYSSDISDVVYGLHSQAIVWQGLRTMAAVWSQTGHSAVAAEALALSRRLERGLRWAIEVSQRRLRDGSLFVPMRLLDGENPYDSVTESRSGGYWNLVAPYAFASGIFAPDGTGARAIVRYLLLHGARLLGVVRAGAYSLYGLNPEPPTSGVNPVYGLNAARFLADNGRADQLVLSLYGQLAIAMAPGAYVSGEGLSVTPLDGDYFRSMYLPPNGASNGSFLETLRLMLVHETRRPDLAPRGLELGFSTPRGWLEPGKRIAVRRAPTSFGVLSFTIERRADVVRAVIDPPSRTRPTTLRLRLRLPAGTTMRALTLNRRAYARFDPRTSTIDLSGKTGHLVLVSQVETS